jgi:hypothetical protein
LTFDFPALSSAFLALNQLRALNHFFMHYKQELVQFGAKNYPTATQQLG